MEIVDSKYFDEIVSLLAVWGDGCQGMGLPLTGSGTMSGSILMTLPHLMTYMLQVKADAGQYFSMPISIRSGRPEDIHATRAHR